MNTMLIDSDRLGQIDVDEESVIDFPDGILGFPDRHKYAMVSAEDQGVYTWLQALDDPKLAFLAVVPTAFFPEFSPNIPDEECIAIGLSDPNDAQLLSLVTVTDSGVTANLLGPIVLNVRTRLARQVVLADPDLSTRTPITPG
ncbi:MAG: flagellar assembly protein FliW [Microthrixaceae bacterium]|jgi:flagellar assembly factor FliW